MPWKLAIILKPAAGQTVVMEQWDSREGDRALLGPLAKGLEPGCAVDQEDQEASGTCTLSGGRGLEGGWCLLTGSLWQRLSYVLLVLRCDWGGVFTHGG